MTQTITVKSQDPIVGRTAMLIERIFPHPRDFGVRFWDGTEIPVVGKTKFWLVLNSPSALPHMFMPPIELSIGNAFIMNDFDIEGDIFSALPFMESIAHRPPSTGEFLNLELEILKPPTKNSARVKGRGRARMPGNVHLRERDSIGVPYNHDLANEFYLLWLDRNLQYSYGYFPTGKEDIDTAQELKMEQICRKLRLKRGEYLLDISCGWGGLARYAALKYKVQVLGITRSKNQKAYADEQIACAGLQDRVVVKLEDYRKLDCEEFDKVVSVGMFEQVGRSYLPEYLAKAYRLLKPGGLFLDHGISRRTGTGAASQGFLQKRIFGRGTFLQKHIFPDGELTPVSDAIMIAEKAGFEVCDLENLREHYALTLRHWVNRLAEQHAEAVKVADEVTYRTWRLYMSASVYGFESSNINVNETLLAKMRHEDKSSVPSSCTDLYVF